MKSKITDFIDTEGKLNETRNGNFNRSKRI